MGLLGPYKWISLENDYAAPENLFNAGTIVVPVSHECDDDSQLPVQASASTGRHDTAKWRKVLCDVKPVMSDY